MPTIIEPTVGRVVYYSPGVGEGTVMGPQPFDAHIVYVWALDLINIVFFDHVGDMHKRQTVKLVQEGQSPPASGGYCQWMPYQLNQADKREKAHEAAEVVIVGANEVPPHANVPGVEGASPKGQK